MMRTRLEQLETAVNKIKNLKDTCAATGIGATKMSAKAAGLWELYNQYLQQLDVAKKELLELTVEDSF